MKVFRRRFKSSDLVLSTDRESAGEIDQSDAADNMEIEDIEEISAEDFKHMHKSWHGYYLGGDDDCRTLAEFFGADSETDCDANAK